MNVRAHVIISGRVQGIFFRSRTVKNSQNVGVTGWIRNLQDGRVEAVFEGDKKPVKKMINFCRKGPPGASVKDVKILWEAYTGEYVDFKII